MIGRFFSKEKNLGKYIEENPGCPFKETTCPKISRKKNDLLEHIIKVHVQSETLSCPKCGKEYYTKKSLNRHVKSHGKGFPFLFVTFLTRLQLFNFNL